MCSFELYLQLLERSINQFHPLHLGSHTAFSPPAREIIKMRFAQGFRGVNPKLSPIVILAFLRFYCAFICMRLLALLQILFNSFVRIYHQRKVGLVRSLNDTFDAFNEGAFL